ncbi:hypothetical protein PANT111_230001 [Pantoea brenneri]|uniref:Uncharacterized protein n=1 Tax=Pantoea brenneri TaxID=472694 RepID=A0AAX3J8U2_9GAMM|nr:hypothetical protein PANT111_230001 [Pantoea brenneri]
MEQSTISFPASHSYAQTAEPITTGEADQPVIRIQNRNQTFTVISSPISSFSFSQRYATNIHCNQQTIHCNQ